MIHEDEQVVREVEAYVDGRMTPDRRAAFERRLGDEPALQDELRRLEAVASSLRRRFSPPPLPESLVQRIRTGEPGDVAICATSSDSSGAAIASRPRAAAHPSRLTMLRTHPRRWLAAAASIAITAAGAWLLWSALRPAGGGYVAQPWRSMQRVYHDTVASGFQPQWVCRDEEFRQMFRVQYGQALDLGELPADITALGLSYSHTITPRTTCVLVDAAGEPVIVFIDRVEPDAGVLPETRGDLQSYRRTIGRLVLYEVSRLSRPVVLDRFALPEHTPDQ